jgi:glycine/sarcosine/betaine reductase complex component A
MDYVSILPRKGRGIEPEEIKKKGDKCIMSWLAEKTAIIIGERDGVQAPSIAKCLEAAGAKVVFAITECFV